MTNTLSVTWRVSLLAMAAVAAGAQTTSTSVAPGITIRAGQLGAVSTATGAFIVGAPFGPGNPFEPVTDRPYSAEQITERVQTLADGTHIAQTNLKVMLYRDSEGRTRTEHIFMPPPGAVMVSAPSFIEIADPVAGYRYMLDQHNQVARRTPWSPVFRRPSRTVSASSATGAAFSATPQPTNILPPNPAATASSTVSARPHPEISHEALGTQTIEGITAEGTRITTTYPEGFMGNDRPITVMSETWTSPDLKVILMSKVSDPRNGESTTRLTNISQTDPDPSLFEVPPGYSTVDEQPPTVVR
jgi:hypothetical protein